MIPLDIHSDPICPWCLIGKTRLDRAIEAVGRNPFTTTWRMFRLNPDMPAGGIDRKTYLETKFGGPQGAARVYGMIAETARADGIEMDLDGVSRTPQTLDAHRLVRWAQAEQLQDVMASRLFHAYFREGLDIGDRDVLVRLSGEAGLDAAIVGRLLAGDADRAELEAEEIEARSAGVTGVPCFVIAGRYVLEGAQETERWIPVIRELCDAIDRQGAIR